MPISTAKEEWAPIPRFPYYQVSSLGRIYSELTDSFIQGSRTQWGHRKVNLRSEEMERIVEKEADGTTVERWRHKVMTVSVAVLVAQAFVEPPNMLCDQVILLDGDLWNVAAHNLAWRSRRHAWLYAHQLRVSQPIHYRNLTVANVNRNVEYNCIVDAGMLEGLIFDEIWKSTYSGSRVPPYGHVFEVTERV